MSLYLIVNDVTFEPLSVALVDGAPPSLSTGTYYDTGQATVENATEDRLEVVVRGFPDLPPPMREMAGGHMLVLLELTAGKRGRLVRDESDPAAWRWKLSWG